MDFTRAGCSALSPRITVDGFGRWPRGRALTNWRVVFESPLQMMADNPFNTANILHGFIASVPTTWDEARAACGAATGQIMARRKGDRWFIGVLPTTSPIPPRSLISAGRSYTMTSFEDGVNADLQAMDYKKRRRKVDASTVVKIDMVTQWRLGGRNRIGVPGPGVHPRSVGKRCPDLP